MPLCINFPKATLNNVLKLYTMSYINICYCINKHWLSSSDAPPVNILILNYLSLLVMLSKILIYGSFNSFKTTLSLSLKGYVYNY